jgi:predicted acetyltransferase
MRSEGFVTSALYPATASLYRSLGWEFAGHWTRHAIAIERLRGVRRPERGRVRRAGVEDLEAIEQLRTLLAAEHDGAIDRGDWVLPVYRRRFDMLHTYVAVDDAGAIEGALVYRHEPTGGVGGYDYDLDIRELFAASADALGALLWVVASSSSVSRQAFVRGWPDDSPRWLVPELRPTVQMQMRWMLRLLDVPAALEARGGPPGMKARVALGVRDEMVADNDDEFVLSVEDGEARVTREAGTRTTRAIALDIGALSSLYSGHTTCATLARMGRLRGGDPEREWATLDAIFAGRAPAMVDEF